MGSRPLEIARELGVTATDAETIRIARRKTVLVRIAQAATSILATIAGYAAGRALSTAHGPDGYPYLPLFTAPALFAGTSRRSWIATAVVAVMGFLTLFFITWDSTGESFGAGMKYSVYFRR